MGLRGVSLLGLFGLGLCACGAVYPEISTPVRAGGHAPSRSAAAR